MAELDRMAGSGIYEIPGLDGMDLSPTDAVDDAGAASFEAGDSCGILEETSGTR